MNDTLKVAGRIGAELGAAKADNERLREALRWYEEKVAECRKIGSLGDNARQALDRDGGFRARDALSQQAEPADTYTAVDMATAAAQGFRDGQAAVEQAVAQDERDEFYAGLYKKSAPMWHRLHELAISKGYDHVQFAIECAPVYRCDCMGARKVAIDMAGNTIPCECVAASNETEQAPAQDEREVAAVIGFYEGEREPRLLSWNVLPNGEHRLYTRPAQTEQQPTAVPEGWKLVPVQPTAEMLAAVTTSTFEPLRQEAMKMAREDYQAMLYAAPIAQTAPQGKFRMGDLVKKSTGSEWVGRVVGWYSTEQTKEGYAVESSAHRNSVQIYPAKALEAAE